MYSAVGGVHATYATAGAWCRRFSHSLVWSPVGRSPDRSQNWHTSSLLGVKFRCNDPSDDQDKMAPVRRDRPSRTTPPRGSPAGSPAGARTSKSISLASSQCCRAAPSDFDAGWWSTSARRSSVTAELSGVNPQHVDQGVSSARFAASVVASRSTSLSICTHPRAVASPPSRTPVTHRF